VAAVAVLVKDPAPARLFRVESEFFIGLAPLPTAARENPNEKPRQQKRRDDEQTSQVVTSEKTVWPELESKHG
jgi:hypothetical protein